MKAVASDAIANMKANSGAIKNKHLKVRRAAYGSQPEVLTDIFLEQTNIAI